MALFISQITAIFFKFIAEICKLKIKLNIKITLNICMK